MLTKLDADIRQQHSHLQATPQTQQVASPQDLPAAAASPAAAEAAAAALRLRGGWHPAKQRCAALEAVDAISAQFRILFRSIQG